MGLKVSFSGIFHIINEICLMAIELLRPLISSWVGSHSLGFWGNRFDASDLTLGLSTWCLPGSRWPLLGLPEGTRAVSTGWAARGLLVGEGCGGIAMLVPPAHLVSPGSGGSLRPSGTERTDVRFGLTGVVRISRKLCWRRGCHTDVPRSASIHLSFLSCQMTATCC